MKWHIALGTLAVLFTLGVLAYVAVGEPQRMESFTRAYESRSIERGAALFESNCRSCHGPQGRGIPGVAPSINAADLFNGQWLADIGYTGTLEDYLEGVIAAGRPIPSAGANYPQRMPTWGQEFGGPLRKDQVKSLVAFIMNWERVALESGEPAGAQPSGEAFGTDIKAPLPPGDPEAGAALAGGAAGCSACHEVSAVGPPWAAEGDQPGLGARAETRLQAPDYTGSAQTPEEYLVESTVLPKVYVPDGYAAGVMPDNYGERLTPQEIADLVAYMLSLR